jgi:RND family efflux transporter MFP subunit
MRAINSFSILIFALLAGAAAFAQTVEVAPVVAKAIDRTIDLPGELLPYESVEIHARVPGYVEKVLVDRGSVVKRGDPLIELTAPEMKARIAEIESRVEAAQADIVQATAQQAAAEATYEHLKKAAETPGAIAGNELVQAEKQVDAAKAVAGSRQQAKSAAEAALRAQRELESYLRIAAPFDGVITERLAHPGALVKADSEPALLVLQQIARLRLVVAVPEQNLGTAPRGTRVEFRVAAYAQRTYSASIARIAHALDEKTRTMPVELDVTNRDGSLSPGMYPTVKWPAQSGQARLLVPATAVVTTTERMFVIRVREGKTQWVDVRKGAASGDFVEAIGALRPGDLVVKRASDELQDGVTVQVKR